MPDDLERLDEDLAAGRVDASTYRRRRDALVATEAAVPPPASPSAPPLPSAPPPPPAPARPADPFPPPFRWADEAPQPSAERTQVVPGAAVGRTRSAPVPPHLTVPPWGTGVAGPPRPVPRDRARMQGPEVFGRRPGPRPAAILGTVFVVVLALVVLVASFLL